MPPILRPKLIVFLFPFFLCRTALAGASESSAPVKITEGADRLVMENGIVSLMFATQSKAVTSIKYRVNGRDLELGDGKAAMYFDANLGGGVRPDYFHPLSQPDSRLSVVASGPDSAEVAAVSEPTPFFPFHTEVHWILTRDTPGFTCTSSLNMVRAWRRLP